MCPKVSPNGKFAAWHEDGSIKFGDNKELRFLPLLKGIKVDPEYTVGLWSNDNKKIFLFESRKTNAAPITTLIEVDVDTGKKRSIALDFGKKTLGRYIKISPKGGTLYFIALFAPGSSFDYSRYNTYELNIEKLDWSKPVVKPALFMRDISGFDFNDEDQMVFSIQQMFRTKFPILRVTGIFLLDFNTKKVTRLTNDVAGNYPKFSSDGKRIRYIRKEGRWDNFYTYTLKKKR